MNETRRTVIYAVVAVACVGLAWWLSPSVEITPDELVKAKVGTEFYPDFTDPNEPTSIRVVSFDEAKASIKPFGVKFENGKWTIPSHHNYPADGADRLAKTAASAMHIKRDQLASTSKQYHEQLGVIDPLDEDQAKLKGRGQRITVSKGETVLVDMIIGKQLKDRPGFYFVRMPGEDSTYVAKIDIDLSTKFADWVETDLLKLNRDDLNEIVVNNYSIDRDRGVLNQGEINKLEREKSTDPWKLEGLDEATEEVDVSKVNAMLSALDDLRLVGVRPKQKGLRADLTLDRDYVKKQSDLDAILLDLRSRGYELVPDQNSKQLKLYSDQGELVAATNKGAVYTLKFGETFLGDEAEIEVGIEADKKKDAEEGQKEDQKPAQNKQPSRYLFVTTQFDEEYLGPKPQEPEKPEGLAEEETPAKKKPAKKTTSEKKSAGDRQANDEAPGGDAADKPNAPTTETLQDESDDGDNETGGPQDECGPPSVLDDADDPAADDPEDAKSDDADDKESDESADQNKADDDAQPDDAARKDAAAEKKAEPTGKDAPKEKSPDEIKKEYDQKLKQYKSDLKAYEQKIEEGKKKVEELNARFGNWYYVISAENFNKLHLSRKELVKEKAKSAEDKKTGDETKSDKPSSDPFDANAAKEPGDESAGEESPDDDNPAEDQGKGPDEAGDPSDGQ